MDNERVERGDEVKDMVSGWQGIVIAEHLYLHGCRRLSVQPPVDKDGKNKDPLSFDEGQLEIVTKGKVPCNPAYKTITISEDNARQPKKEASAPTDRPPGGPADCEDVRPEPPASR